MRNIREDRNEYRDPSQTLGRVSPFNISKNHMTLRNFTLDEVAELYAQHTQDTGQVFLPEAVDASFEMTQGQPWLVNAVACEVVEKIYRRAKTFTMFSRLCKAEPSSRLRLARLMTTRTGSKGAGSACASNDLPVNH